MSVNCLFYYFWTGDILPAHPADASLHGRTDINAFAVVFFVFFLFFSLVRSERLPGSLMIWHSGMFRILNNNWRERTRLISRLCIRKQGSATRTPTSISFCSLCRSNCDQDVMSPKTCMQIEGMLSPFDFICERVSCEIKDYFCQGSNRIF